MTQTLTKEEFDMIGHALGSYSILFELGWRNHYCATPDEEPLWNSLVERGMAESLLANKTHFYKITERGKEAYNQYLSRGK